MSATTAVKVGRVYRINSISTGGWFWTCYALVGNRSGSDSGQVADRDEACRLVEAAYDEMVSRELGRSLRQ